MRRQRQRQLRRAQETRVGPKTIVISERGPDNPRRPQPMRCKLCCDLAWARSDERLDEHWDPIGLRGTDGVVRCRGCGGAYASEPEPERGSLIRSSAGMAVQHGSLHGDAKRYPNRPSRARAP